MARRARAWQLPSLSWSAARKAGLRGGEVAGLFVETAVGHVCEGEVWLQPQRRLEVIGGKIELAFLLQE